MAETTQAKAPKTIPFGKEAFVSNDKTTIRWLGNAGVFINSHGCCIMVDPLLEGFDMPLLIDMPILPNEVPSLNAVLITHCDNDHFSIPTCKDLSKVCPEFHSTKYVAELMINSDIKGMGHDIYASFNIESIGVKLTPADHAWQNAYGTPDREYKLEDYCGFWIDTPEGSIWIPGDSKLMKEQLEMENPKVIIFDFSDNEWHIGLDGAVKLANTYPNADLILSHWGSVNAPDMTPFNGNPAILFDKIINPKRIHIMAPGQEFVL